MRELVVATFMQPTSKQYTHFNCRLRVARFILGLSIAVIIAF